MANEFSTNGDAPGERHSAAVSETPAVSGRRLLAIMASVLLGILLAALDQTVVGPALPTIIRDLNGFDYYTWVVTIYLLTSTISVPISGKLSDMYGRKWLYLAGIVIFLLGSVLSGLSADIGQLILYRGIQGIGAGILFANAFAIIADLIPPRERGKWQGVFGSVFGLASVVGPTIGGFLTDNLDWRWVFYVNLPVGAVAMAVLLTTFPSDTKAHVKRSVDWLGAAALTAGVSPLLLALSLGGTDTPLTIPFFGKVTDWEWTSPTILGLFAASVVFLAAFVLIELRAKEPIIPLNLFKNRTFTLSVITVFVTGLGMFGAILYIPLFIQAIQGDSATSSGNAITPMTLAIVMSSVITGQVISRTGKYRVIGVAGMALVTVGMFLLYTMNTGTERLTTIIYMVIMGLGLGVAFPLYTLIVQNAFPIQQVGVVTAAVQFFRSIGSTVGVAILGSVVNTRFHDQFGPEFAAQTGALGIPAQFADRLAAGLSNVNPQVLVGAEGAQQLHQQLTTLIPQQFASFIPTIEQAIFGAMKPALFTGIQEAFLIGAVLLAVGVITTAFIPEIPLRRTNAPAGASAGGHGSRGMAALAEGAEPEMEEAGKELVAAGLPGGTSLPPEDEPRLRA